MIELNDDMKIDSLKRKIDVLTAENEKLKNQCNNLIMELDYEKSKPKRKEEKEVIDPKMIDTAFLVNRVGGLWGFSVEDWRRLQRRFNIFKV